MSNTLTSHSTTADSKDEKEHLTGLKALAKARELLAGFRSAMFVTQSKDGRDPNIRPMGIQGDARTFGGTLWFFADRRSDKVREVTREPRTSLVFQSDDDSRYLCLSGTSSVVDDRAKMRELYTPLLKTWFPDGLEDPQLTLIRFDADSGSYWDSPGGMLQVLSAFTKAVVTGTPGKGGEAGTLDLDS